jgi:hypothetical protein
MNTKIATVSTITITDPDPCAVLACDKRTEPIRECWRAGCGFEWARAAAEDRKAREGKDAEARENVCR